MQKHSKVIIIFYEKAFVRGIRLDGTCSESTAIGVQSGCAVVWRRNASSVRGYNKTGRGAKQLPQSV